MRRLLLLTLIILHICIGHAVAGERIALVIGNSDYRNAPRLPNPYNDATDVAAAFERLRFSVLLVRNGSFDTMRRSLMDFAQRVAGADIAVVYFAGHGMEIRDENWLIPIDAELRMDVLAGQEAISLGSVMPIISKAQKLGLVILDACRDNPFGRQMQMSQPGRAVAPRGFVAIEPPNSVLVAFAAKHGTTADDGTGRNSPFTTALLHNLEIPGLEINYLFRNVHDEVLSATQRQQEPYIYGTLSREPIYLKAATDAQSASATTPAAPVERDNKPAPASNSPSEAERAWALTKDTTSRAVLQAFATRFSGTLYGDLANARLVELEQTEQKPQEQKPQEQKPQDKVALVVPAPAPSQPAGPKVFENPTINGIHVDRCMRWGPEGCQAPSANHWCRSKGFARATSWSSKNMRPTIFQDPKSSVKECDYFFCGGFTRITCE